MGELINSSLILLGTAAGACGISFFIREKKMGKIRICVMLLGIFAGLWCLGFGLMGMYTTPMELTITRALGLFSIVGYLSVALVTILLLINASKLYCCIVTVLYIAYGLSDAILMTGPQNNRYIQVDGRMAYYSLNTFASNYHKVYIAISLILILGVACIWVNKRKMKQNKRIILVLIMAHICLVLLCIPDTILPALGLPSFPSSCYGVAFSYFILWHNCVYNNAFSITVQNVSSYVYQAMNVNILVFDMDRRLYMANDYSHTFFGMSQVMGQSLSDFFEIESNEADECFDKAVNGTIEELKMHTRENGKICNLRFTVARDKGEKPYCVIIFAYDLTKEEQMLEALKAANEAKSNFLSNMSHEIRTPINAIIGMNEMILREAENEQLLEYFSSIQNSSATLMTIVNDILDISKIDSGKVEIIENDYELSALLIESYNMIIEKAAQKNIAVNVYCDETIPCLLHGDAVRIKQILLNLLTNAVKYTEEGSVKLCVTGEISEQKFLLKIAVQDTGIGISKEDMDKLFCKFERLNLKKNRNIEGTGLGLFITKMLTELMGGTIEVESEYGKGSVFTVVIPQKCADITPIGKIDLVALGKDAAGYKYETHFTAPDARILVVDDIEINLKVFQNLLKQLHMQIDTALSGKKCLELACENQYDIIFVDHMMPEMDGVATLEKLKGDSQNKNIETPVIMLTANALSGMKEMYLEKGFTDYLSKPIDAGELEGKIEKYLPPRKILAKTKPSRGSDKAESITDPFLVRMKNAVPDMNMNRAIQYCAGNEEFYVQCLNYYCNNGRKELIEKTYEAKEWNRYKIEVHTLKGNSRTLGFEALGDIAEKVQHAAEAQDISYINDNHGRMINELERIIRAIKNCL